MRIWKVWSARIILFVLLLSGLVAAVDAQEEPTAVEDEEGRPLLVGVHHAPPFVFQHEETNSEFATAFLEVRSLNRLPQHYAFALTEESSLLEAMNQVILRVITQPGWQDIVARYTP